MELPLLVPAASGGSVGDAGWREHHLNETNDTHRTPFMYQKLHPSPVPLPNFVLEGLISSLISWPLNRTVTGTSGAYSEQLNDLMYGDNVTGNRSSIPIRANVTSSALLEPPGVVNLSLLSIISTLGPSDTAFSSSVFGGGRFGHERGESWLVTLLWSMLFYPMVVLAAAGNLLVIWIIATKPMMRTVMNRYLLNLTLSDFLSITFNASFNFIFMLNEHWPFGQLYCIINNFITNLTIASSVCTIMLISLDRYYAIVHPLRPRQSRRRFYLSIGSIWFFSVFFSIPTLLYSDTMTVTEEPLVVVPTSPTEQQWIDPALLLHMLTNNNHNRAQEVAPNPVRTPLPPVPDTRTLCILRWPDGISGFSTYEFLYNLAFLILFYLVPLLTMVVALVLMSRVLWPGERIGEHTTLPQHALIRSKRKVVCMLICVITVFAVCWLPYHSYFISIYLWPSLIQTLAIKHIFLAFYWFAMANSLFNPIILFAMNRRIRNYILYYLKFTCCLFGLHKRTFPRNCRRSSLQMMMNKAGQMGHLQLGQVVGRQGLSDPQHQAYRQRKMPICHCARAESCANEHRLCLTLANGPQARLITNGGVPGVPVANGEVVTRTGSGSSSVSSSGSSSARPLCSKRRYEQEEMSNHHSCPPMLESSERSRLSQHSECLTSCPNICRTGGMCATGRRESTQLISHHQWHSCSAALDRRPYSICNGEEHSHHHHQHRNSTLHNTIIEPEVSTRRSSHLAFLRSGWRFPRRSLATPVQLVTAKHRHRYHYRANFTPRATGTDSAPDTNTAL